MLRHLLDRERQLIERKRANLYPNANAAAMNNRNPTFSVKEISKILTEFDPVGKCAKEFIARIVALYTVYQWDEKL